MTPAQLRAARALLDWTQPTLAERSKVALNTIKSFEAGASDPRQSTIIALKRTLSVAGVEFLDGTREHGPGVRLREPQK
jgi:predicted transcriptional regulator